ncbi:SusC/RagA family TonB-linked outer membrane protein [Flavihumibacter sp. CACIAM 22H1]|uniref:SusC/RagA family TonB-linked outer membrane protein n=1 Tax=Flavihumibacter sp. CACIAM 22H1 TaxID=1812911 RepID=UPI0007A7C6D5|nr:SusC/RagA family TonB-linked outer membrane protein [Flavihumibacter sp. CACIAM 22H1]KYP15747.1 MAG: SusC/RagA family TonB-linked outer membrane protein [Flavihumibacter sp. CACIAM 22H1]
MRALTLAILLTISGVIMAERSTGQDLSKIRISINVKNVPLKAALKKIEGSTDLSFSFKTADIAHFRNISYAAENISVDKVLKALFEDTGLEYEVINSNIIIRKPEVPTTVTPPREEDKLEGGIRGRVVNNKGEPVANASILVTGINQGTAADLEGRFSLSGLKPGTYTLVISAIGFGKIEKTVTVTDNSITSVDIVMVEDNADMAEVTVTALGIRREKRELGYSAQEVKGDALVASRQPNIVNALQGQAAGLQINSGGGAPGQGSKIILRGLNSLDPNRDFQPLFIIDGIPVDNTTDVSDGSSLYGISNRAADINPDDIESINILKGGAATALYGLRASTGAIIITTKSGKAGKLRGSITSTYGVDEINKYPETQTRYTQGWLGEYDPSSFWPTTGPTIEEAKAIDPTHPDKIFNNFKHGYKTGNSFRNSLNISGGSERATFTGTFSQFNQEGIMPFTDYKNFSVKVGGEFKLSEKVKMGSSLNYVKSGGRRGNADRYNENLTYFSPRWDIWDYINENGTQKTIVGSGNDNPVYVLRGVDYRDNVDRILTNTHMSYAPTKWLDINYRFGADIYSDGRTQKTPGPMGLPDEIYPASDFGFGTISEYNARNTILNSTLMLNFKNKIGKHLSSSLKLGHDLYSTKRSTVYANGDTLVVPNFYNLNNAKRVTGSNSLREYRIIGLFADWTVSWKNYLYMTLTYRNDYTSTLSKDNRSFSYPSASLSYIFSETFTMPDWFSFGKARVSVAKIGKDAVPYATSSGFSLGTPLNNNVIPFFLSTQTGDPNLRPEFTTSYEGGLELKFLQNRLGLDFTYYNNTSKDLIIPVKVPVTSGYDQIYLNSGSVRNRGVEISISGTPVQTRDFSWDIRANFTSNKNTVLSIYPDLTEIAIASQFGYLSATVTQKYIPGYPVGALFGRTFMRYYGDKTEDPARLDKSLPIVIGANGFPVLNPASKQQYIANSQPKWIGSLGSTLRYKGLSLSFLFDTQQGVYRYNQLSNFLGAFLTNKESENRNDVIVFDGVLADGTPNTKPVWLGQGVGPDGVNYGNGYYRNYYRGASETFIEDASWIRLRTLSLGYTIPSAIVTKSGFLTGAGITFSGNNLWINTKWKGFDPEASSTSSGSVADGFSGFTYPATRSYLVSLNLNF